MSNMGIKKGISFEREYGKKRAEKIKRKISKNNAKYWLGKKHPQKEKTKTKISSTLKKKHKTRELKITGAAKKYHENPEEHYNYIDGRSKTLSPMRYGDDWEEIRYLVYLRDDFMCQDCGITLLECKEKHNTSLHVHHIIPFLIDFDNSLSNLITLCPICHMKRERNLIKNRQKKV